VEQHNLKIISIEYVTYDVLRFQTEKPQHINFTPGQAADISINKEGWQNEIRPFTFTCLPENDYLEFTIKTYPSHKSVTNELLHLKTNDELILHNVFGTIAYKGEGMFIAGGAGVTPFISIFRYLQTKNEIGNNKLIFANKTKSDIILEQEFNELLGNNSVNILSDENVNGYTYGRVTEDFLTANSVGLYKIFYVCGPPPMMDSIEKQLMDLHVNENSIVKEAL